MKNICKKNIVLIVFLITVLIVLSAARSRSHKKKSHFKYDAKRTNAPKPTKTICMDVENTLRARHKSCFLRPDTGPCRSDIMQWYYDVKQKNCYRFFWGGCQGNGNRFEDEKKCLEYCFLNNTAPAPEIPSFCSLAFDFGTCYGQYYRWAWDSLGKTCKRRLYSGCGGNQNNFETQAECMRTCLKPPSNTLLRLHKIRQTTCFPFNIDSLQ